MAFETTYEAFHARVTADYGPAEADRLCPAYAREFAATCRRDAAAVPPPPDRDVLLRLADQMDPDRQGVPDAERT